MKKAIVTGANGFVGSNLVRELIRQEVQVLAVGHDNRFQNLPEDDRILRLSLDMDDIIALEGKVSPGQYDTFYHFAWTGSAGADRTNETLQMKNVQWTCDCIRMAHQIGCNNFVCAGSIMEKEVIATTFAQGNSPGPASIYGAAKLAAHCMAKPIANQVGINLIWAVITNAYGEGEVSPRFVNTTIRKIIRQEPLQFTAATQNYDFVHIADVARAFYCIGESGKANCEYLIGSSNARPLREFIQEMQQSLAPDAELQFGDIPFAGINMSLEEFDTSFTERDTGFRAEISFAEGVKRTMQWLQEVEE